MGDDFQEKTEEPSQKKLDDARKKGQVARSQDFNSALVLLVGFFVLFIFGRFFHNGLRDLMIAVYSNLSMTWTTQDTVAFWIRQGLIYCSMLMMPLFGGIILVGVVANVTQVGFMVSTENLSPKWKQINIFDPSSYKKFVDTKALAKLTFGLGKMGVVALICYYVIMSSIGDIGQMMQASTKSIYIFILSKAFNMGIMISVVLLSLGIMDLIFQKWKFKQDMKMSKQEIKDERKQSEGDPQLKGKMRSMMQSFSQSRMKDAVPQADVVIANPIHFAIALKYDPEAMGAPVCLAKGSRKMAEAIKAIARDNSVPIVENPPLAQALYKTVEVGYSVPPNFYHAIAEVLAYVYKLNKSLKPIPTKLKPVPTR